jgi:hypothetical protein
MASLPQHQLKKAAVHQPPAKIGWRVLAAAAGGIFVVGLVFGYLAAGLGAPKSIAPSETSVASGAKKGGGVSAGFTMLIERADGSKLIGSAETAGGSVSVIVLFGSDTRMSALVPEHGSAGAESGGEEPAAEEAASYGEISLKPSQFRAGDIVRVASPDVLKEGAVVTADSVTWLMRVVETVSGSQLVTTDFEDASDEDDADADKGLPAPF